METSYLEYSDVFQEDLGYLNRGRIRFDDHKVHFKNAETGKVQMFSSSEIGKLSWIRLGNKPGLRFCLTSGINQRFGGFNEKDFERIRDFAKKAWDVDVEQTEHCLKGWNYGKANINDKMLEFEVDNKLCFEFPLNNVSNCTTGKNEATLEFHQNEDCPISLMEMRFHMPTDPDADDDVDAVEEFRKAVMQYAGIEIETDQPVATLPQILCTTPRGRYDIKVYQNHLSLHGKTYDYKISIKTITRLFLLPHKDGRHMYFVISLNPPIRQGQTRYHFLVLEFNKDEEIDLDIGLTLDQIQEQYKGKLDKAISGTLFEVVSKIFRVIVDMKITVPGNFVGHSGTPALMCAHKQASGFLYPLEKGFVYVHKPPMYIRFEEISSVNFARSDVSTRSFDFEIEMKTGNTFVFNSVEKEEYNRLYDFVRNKHLRVRNAKRLDKPAYNEDDFAGSEEEIDPYKETLKKEAREKEQAAADDTDSDDEEFDLEKDMRKQKEEKNTSGSESEPSEEYESDNEDEKKEKKLKNVKSEVPEKPKKDKKDVTEKGTKSGTKKERKKKDPNAPKKPQSAYVFWFTQNYSTIREEGASATEAAQRAGKIWKEMSSDLKKKYDQKAAEDKERYIREMKVYTERGGAVAPSTSTPKSSMPPKATSSPTKLSSKPKSKEYVSDDMDSSESDTSKKHAKKEPSDEDISDDEDMSD